MGMYSQKYGRTTKDKTAQYRQTNLTTGSTKSGGATEKRGSIRPTKMKGA